MTKTVKIIIYIAILLFVYFAISTIYKSCSHTTDDIIELQDDNTTSDEEDDFFKDFDEEATDEHSENEITENEVTELIGEDEDIDYKSLDDRLTGDDDSTVDKEKEWVEEKPTAKPSSSNHYNSSNSAGKYLIVAGSFLVEQNASNLVSKLKKMGYRDAEVVVFDDSRYYTVVANRFNTKSEANNMVSSLKNKRVDCYVHTKTY